MPSGDSKAEAGREKDTRPAIQNTHKFTAAALPLHFKVLRAVWRTFQQPADRPGCARLISISYSHYVERVRWVLDLSPLRLMYSEDAHPPGLAMFAVQDVTEGSESSCPVLVLPAGLPDDRRNPHGEVIHDSNVIVPHLAAMFPGGATDPCGDAGLGWLYPKPLEKEIRAYEDHLAEQLGSNVRQYAYTHLLEPEIWAAKSRLGGPISRHCALVEVFIHKLISSQIGKVMRKLMRCYPDRLPACEKSLDDVFADAAKRLGKSKYLCGDTVTAADITFAALAYPCACPPGLQQQPLGGRLLTHHRHVA